jgi:hypothetical protein
MSYVAAREGFGGYIYFKNNIDDSPKWSHDISEAMRFKSEKEAIKKSDKTGVYAGSIIAIEVDQ